jgi:hypothetical protein
MDTKGGHEALSNKEVDSIATTEQVSALGADITSADASATEMAPAEIKSIVSGPSGGSGGGRRVL